MECEAMTDPVKVDPKHYSLKALAWREAHFGPTDRRTIETRDVLRRASR